MDNRIIVNGGGREDERFDQSIHMHIGPRCEVGGGFRCGAKQFGYFNYRSKGNLRGHFIIGDLVFRETCVEYANLGNPANPTADLAIFDLRGTVVPERMNVISTMYGHQLPDEFFRGGRTIRGAKSFPDNTPGLKGDTYDNGTSRWRCAASHLTAATWEPSV